jgi:hypothetical protein
MGLPQRSYNTQNKQAVLHLGSGARIDSHPTYFTAYDSKHDVTRSGIICMFHHYAAGGQPVIDPMGIVPFDDDSIEIHKSTVDIRGQLPGGFRFSPKLQMTKEYEDRLKAKSSLGRKLITDTVLVSVNSSNNEWVVRTGDEVGVAYASFGGSVVFNFKTMYFVAAVSNFSFVHRYSAEDPPFEFYRIITGAWREDRVYEIVTQPSAAKLVPFAVRCGMDVMAINAGQYQTPDMDEIGDTDLWTGFPFKSGRKEDYWSVIPYLKNVDDVNALKKMYDYLMTKIWVTDKMKSTVDAAVTEYILWPGRTFIQFSPRHAQFCEANTNLRRLGAYRAGLAILVTVVKNFMAFEFVNSKDGRWYAFAGSKGVIGVSMVSMDQLDDPLFAGDAPVYRNYTTAVGQLPEAANIEATFAESSNGDVYKKPEFVGMIRTYLGTKGYGVLIGSNYYSFGNILKKLVEMHTDEFGGDLGTRLSVRVAHLIFTVFIYDNVYQCAIANYRASARIGTARSAGYVSGIDVEAAMSTEILRGIEKEWGRMSM